MQKKCREVQYKWVQFTTGVKNYKSTGIVYELCKIFTKIKAQDLRKRE